MKPVTPNVPRSVRPRSRRAGALVVCVLILASINLAVMSSVNAGGDDARLASIRADTARAFYACESGAALVVGEFSAGRAVPAGTITLAPGITVSITTSGASAPMDVVIVGASGQARRRLEVRLEQ